MLLSLNGCIYLLFYKSPSPEKFNLYQQKTLGIKGDSKININGFYCYPNPDTYLNSGKIYTGYYRFINSGELRIEEWVPQNKLDSVYDFCKESIELDIDKALYGYYLTNGDSIKMEYVKEYRESMRNEFYESTGILSKNGDTLYVKEQQKRKDGKTDLLNRTCIFYPFPE